jgi:uncharacterized protein (TIGR03437 family)
MKFITTPVLCLCAAIAPAALGQTASYTNTAQTVKLTGLGGTGGVGVSRVDWGTCVFDGTNTNCTATSPYTGVGGGGTITIVLTYAGTGQSPFIGTSNSPGSNYVNLSIVGNGFATAVVSVTENTGAKVTFLTNNFLFFFNPDATCTGVPSISCGVGQVGLTPNATITGTVFGSFDQTPVIQSVITAGDYGAFPAVAPGTWMEIYGTNLANVMQQTWAGSDFHGNIGPTSVGATTVTIGGQSAFLDYVSPGQVDAQVPSNVGVGMQQQVVVTTPGGTSVSFPITVNPTEPGLLAPGVFHLPAGQYVGAQFSDGVTFVLPPGAINGVPAARAHPGDTIVFYGIGFGPVTPDIPAGEIVGQANNLNATFVASFAGVAGKTVFAGLSGGFLGLYQFNVTVPSVPASDTVPLTFSLNGVPGTQKLIIAITN